MDKIIEANSTAVPITTSVCEKEKNHLLLNISNDTVLGTKNEDAMKDGDFQSIVLQVTFCKEHSVKTT